LNRLLGLNKGFLLGDGKRSSEQRDCANGKENTRSVWTNSRVIDEDHQAEELQARLTYDSLHKDLGLEQVGHQRRI